MATALKKWPDLRRHGWDLGIRLDSVKRPAGVFLERLRADAAPLDITACEQFGFGTIEGLNAHGYDEPGFRLTVDTLRYTMEDVARWLPSFQSSLDTSDERPRILTALQAETLRIVDASEYPSPADLRTLDFSTGRPGWDIDQDEFERLRDARSFVIQPDDSVLVLASRLRFALPDASQPERETAAESALSSLRRNGHALHALRRLGTREFSPPVRFFAPGAAVDASFADWAVLVNSADHHGMREPPPVQDLVGDTGVPEDSPRAADRIDDVGEKIGGARKDFYRRSLMSSDLDDMNAAERSKYVKVSNIWPLKIKEMIDGGTRPSVVAFLRDLRRRIPEPSAHLGIPELRAFVDAVASLRDIFEKVRTLEDLTEACNEAERLCIDEWGDREFQFGREGGTYRARAYWQTGARDAKPLGWTYQLERAYNDHDYEAALRRRLLPQGQRRQVDDEEPQLPERPHLDTLSSEGMTDFRLGRDILPETLMSVFGFRAVEFGNWLPQDERQRVINYAYDALLTMCHVLNLPPAHASLDGRLALAFGARGRAKASAHYEPARVVVNLTRLKGAGSFAHEYWHAFDDWLGMGGKMIAGRQPSPYVTDAALSAIEKSHVAALPTSLFGRVFEVVSACRARKETEQEALLRSQEKAATHRGWAGSWMVSKLREALVDQRGIDGVIAGKEAEALATALIDSAIESSSDADLSYDAFDAARAADLVFRTLKTAYGVKLPPKNREQIIANLRTVARQTRNVEILENPDSFDVKPQRANLDTAYFRQAKKLDAGRSKTYWGEATELAARAFESYVFDRLRDSGVSCDYLVHGVEPDRYASAGYKGNPYPTGEEREAINAAFDAAFATLKQEFELADFQIPDLSLHQPDVPVSRRKIAASLS